MTLPTQLYDTAGNVEILDAVRLSFDSQNTARLAGASQPYIAVSTVSPPTFSAPQGTLCLSTVGNSTSTRLYVNTNGTTGWTAITTAT